MFKRIGIAALLACVAYVMHKEFFEDDMNDDNNSVEYVDSTEVSDAVDFAQDLDTFIQPEFEKVIDAAFARELVCRAIRNNGYVTTPYIMHVAGVVKGNVNKPMLDDLINHRANPNMGYTDISDFKEKILMSNTNKWILTNKPPKNIKEFIKNGSRQETDQGIS